VACSRCHHLRNLAPIFPSEIDSEPVITKLSD
jgi:hypothetical protein